jgi:hypothetical protein
MSAFARASVLALKEIPAANASIEGDEIVYRDYVDLSVAVATPKGLVTPVVRNAEGMNFIEIEKEIAALGKKVRVPLHGALISRASVALWFSYCCAFCFLLGQGWQIGT